MRLSDAGLHRRQTKAVYPNHPFPPWLTEEVPRDRSNRLLEALSLVRPNTPIVFVSGRSFAEHL